MKWHHVILWVHYAVYLRRKCFKGLLLLLKVRMPVVDASNPADHMPNTSLVKVDLVFLECRNDRLTAVGEDETFSFALSVGHEWARGKSTPRLHQYKQRCRTEWPNTINLGLVPRRRQCPNLAVYLTPSHFSSLRTSCGGK